MLKGGGKPEPEFMIMRTPHFALRPWTVYRYTDTWPLRRFFNFTVRGEGLSTCTGTSLGPNTFPVGPHNRGGDLALQIRSGPLGTVCRAGSPGIAVSENVRLTAIDWAIERDGTKCEAGDAASRKVDENVVIAPGHLPDDNVGAYMGGLQPTISSLIGVTQPALRPDQHIVGFAHSWLWCDKTLINDHGVRIVLRSATFEGPANANMP